MRGSRKIALKYEQSFPSPWELAGQQVAAALDGVCAAVVIGEDLSATAYVALGIARAQAKRRRAAVADLIGEAPPIQALVPDDASYGLSDGILYGVSITKLAYQVEGIPNLHILPSGSGPIDHEAVLRSERWARLAEGVREVGALLLVAAPGRAKGLESIVAAMDGVVAVGASPVPPGLRLITRVPAALAVQAPARVRARTPASGQTSVRPITPPLGSPVQEAPPATPPPLPVEQPPSVAATPVLPVDPTAAPPVAPSAPAPTAPSVPSLAATVLAPPKPLDEPILPPAAPAPPLDAGAGTRSAPEPSTPLAPAPQSVAPLPVAPPPPAPMTPPSVSGPQASASPAATAPADRRVDVTSLPGQPTGDVALMDQSNAITVAFRVRSTPATAPRITPPPSRAVSPAPGAESRPITEYERASVSRVAAHIAATRLRSSLAINAQRARAAAAAGPASPAEGAALQSPPAATIHIQSAPSHQSPTGPTPLRKEAAITPAAGKQAVSKEPLRAVHIPHAHSGALWTAIAGLALAVVSAVVWASSRLAPPPEPKPAQPAAIVGDTLLNPDSIVPFNPPASASQDSPLSGGTPFAVRVAAVGSETDANARLEALDGKATGVLTFTPLSRTPGTAGRYQIIAGAYGDSSAADSLLVLLKVRHQLDRAQGKVVRVPYALVVQRGIARDQAPTFVRGYRLKGLPVYALMQEDGTATLYAGAFETREQGSLLLAIFRSGGEEPPIAQRTGRPF